MATPPKGIDLAALQAGAERMTIRAACAAIVDPAQRGDVARIAMHLGFDDEHDELLALVRFLAEDGCQALLENRVVGKQGPWGDSKMSVLLGSLQHLLQGALLAGVSDEADADGVRPAFDAVVAVLDTQRKRLTNSLRQRSRKAEAAVVVVEAAGGGAAPAQPAAAATPDAQVGAILARIKQQRDACLDAIEGQPPEVAFGMLRLLVQLQALDLDRLEAATA